jgi:hypothetical protein
MAESSLGPQTVHRRRQEVVAEVECADDERRRPKVASSVGVKPPVTCLARDACENSGRMTQRIRIRVDGEYTRVLGVCTSQPA